MSPLAQIALLLYQILTGQISIGQAIYKLAGELTDTSKEHTEYATEANAKATYGIVSNDLYGNYKLLLAIQAITPPSGPTIQDVLDAIAALPAGSSIVVPGSSDNAQAVWDHQIQQQMPNGITFDAQAREWLYMLGHSLAIYSATEGVPDGEQPWYRLVFGGSSTGYSLGYNMAITTQPRPADPDFSQLAPGDTVFSFMQRIQPAYGWSGTGPSGVFGTGIAWKNLYGGNQGVWWRTAFDLPVHNRALSAPVYPGLNNYTNLTPTVLTESGEVSGPMHGCHITIDSVKVNTNKQLVAGFTNWFRAGWIAFYNDIGELETLQWLGFDSADYTPKSMAQAYAAVVYLGAATQITVTPWRIN